MVENLTSEPDYIFWCKFDEWSFKEAALLLHGFDPLKYKDIRFNMQGPPVAPQLNEAYTTFLVFKKTHWNYRRFRNSNSAHPFDIFIIAQHKDLPIPEKLIIAIREKKILEQEEENNEIIEAKNFSARERKNLLKAIGMMSWLLMDDKKFIINNRPNAYQITEAVITKAEALKFPIEGLKSLNRKIKEGLEILEEDS